MAHTIVHFEIPASDPEKLATFYTQLFGWKIEKAVPMDYWLISTVAGGEAGVNGGIMRRQNPEQIPINYIGVESVDEFAQKVRALGGRCSSPNRQSRKWAILPSASTPMTMSLPSGRITRKSREPK